MHYKAALMRRLFADVNKIRCKTLKNILSTSSHQRTGKKAAAAAVGFLFNAPRVRVRASSPPGGVQSNAARGRHVASWEQIDDKIEDLLVIVLKVRLSACFHLSPQETYRSRFAAALV